MRPRFSFAEIGVVLRQTLIEEEAVPLGDRHLEGTGRNVVPELLNVLDLLVCG